MAVSEHQLVVQKSQKSLFSISSQRAGLGHVGFAPVFLHGLLISCIVWWLSFFVGVRLPVLSIPPRFLQFSPVAQLCPTLCDPMDCSTLGFPVHHQLLELTQTCVRQVGVAIEPSHPLSSPSPSTFNLSQHQGLFQ